MSHRLHLRRTAHVDISRVTKSRSPQQVSAHGVSLLCREPSATDEVDPSSQTTIDCWAKMPAIAPCDDAWVTEGSMGVARSPAA